MTAQTLPTPPTTPPPRLFDEYSSHPLPAYSATDDESLHSRIEQATALNLPILHEPLFRITSPRSSFGPANHYDEVAANSLQFDIVEALFTAIETGHDDLVADFVSRGYVSPDVTRSGETPLLAAVRAGKPPMVSRLVSLGATVNAFGRSAIPVNPDAYPREYPERTPLMLAAERGNLALVKILMEDYGADDSLIAPDGAIALRLAAVNGHRDIVNFLPARRAGAWLRWKTAHHQEMQRVRRALHRISEFLKFFVWYAPKFLVYDLPKGIAKAIWKRRHRMANWCRKLPGKVGHGLMKLPHKMANGARNVYKVVKKIPRWIKKLGLAIWRLLKAIPIVIKNIAVWFGRGLKSIGEAIFGVLVKFFSLIHTALSAVFSFFRSITPKDIWDGFCYLLRAIFIETPKAIYNFILSVGEMTFNALADLLGCFGKCLWYLGAGLLWLVQYIPLKIWQILEAIGRSMRKAFQEVMAFMNPKRM